MSHVDLRMSGLDDDWLARALQQDTKRHSIPVRKSAINLINIPMLGQKESPDFSFKGPPILIK